MQSNSSYSMQSNSSYSMIRNDEINGNLNIGKEKQFLLSDYKAWSQRIILNRSCIAVVEICWLGDIIVICGLKKVYFL